MMQVLKTVQEWRSARPAVGLGFVPTMGALHQGHLSLVTRSRTENERTLVSLFVNRTQFNDSRDYEGYPRPMEDDLAMLEAAGVDYVFTPTYETLYPDDYRYHLYETELSGELCGAHRPGHFEGMLTVVMKLLQIAQADRAYFGEKDYQQYQLVRGMAEAFFLTTQIVPCSIVREADGLAMSSRNRRLTTEERELAPQLSRVLKQAETVSEAIVELERLGFSVDYVEERWGRRFGAAHLGAVRLIDNVEC